MLQNEINHVSVVAKDLDESTEFYTDLFNMEKIPTPNFGVDVQWLEDSEGQQLHLFERDVPAPQYHHFGITVDNFESVYHAAKERGIITDFRDAEDTTGLYKLPDGAVQLYLTDPSENLVEVNWPNVETLDESIQENIVDRDKLIPQTGEAAEATLSLE